MCLNRLYENALRIPFGFCSALHSHPQEDSPLPLERLHNDGHRKLSQMLRGSKIFVSCSDFSGFRLLVFNYSESVMLLPTRLAIA